MNRETWLNLMAEKMAPRFQELGYPLPKFRVAVGWTSSGKVSHIGGECWHSSASADSAFEILVAPILDDSMAIAAVLAHELTHAAAGFEHGHRGDFAKVMKLLGMVPPMTSSVPGPAFKEWAQPFIDELGAIPHAKIMLHQERGTRGESAPRPERKKGEPQEADQEEQRPFVGGSSNQKKKQTTRLKKAECSQCGYTVRLTQKWLEVGPPGCPLHGAMDADVDLPDDDAE